MSNEVTVVDGDGNVQGSRPVDRGTSLSLPNGLQGQKGSVVIKAHEAGQRVLGEILAAKAAPRDMEEVEREILRQCRDKYFCERALYLKPTGGVLIEGLGIFFAKTLHQIYGNVHYETICHSTDMVAGESQIQCVIWDKERNTTRTETIIVLHKQNRGGKIVGIDDPDGVRLAIARASSFLERNCLMDVFNPALVQRCFEVILATLDQGATAAMADPTATIKQFAEKFGVNPGQIMKFLNITKVDQFKPQHVRRLIALFRSSEADPAIIDRLLKRTGVVDLDAIDKGEEPSKEIAPAETPAKEKGKKAPKEKTPPAQNVETSASSSETATTPTEDRKSVV